MSSFTELEKAIYTALAKKAEDVFLKPNPIYSYEDVIDGCPVINVYNSTSRIMYAVSNNTWRGFHRTPDSIYGSKEIFTGYFTQNKQKILSSLETIKTAEQLNSLEDKICADIKHRLLGNIKTEQLESYNKIRKPVDLYIEHIICMCSELSNCRSNTIKFLFLPLDSQIFASPYIFNRSQLYSHGINENATFKDVKTCVTYTALQNILSKKSSEISSCIGKEFNRIYFDLLWNDRYKKPGKNLFTTNF